MKKVCYFGNYEKNYSRNRIIIKGLEKNGVKVLHCNASGFLIFRYLKLLGQFLNIFRTIDSIIVGFPGYMDIPLAFLLARTFKLKLYYDVFATRYETLVLDRHYIKTDSIKAKIYFYLDKIGIMLADVLIVDTNTHFKLYHEIYGLENTKVIVVYVGSDDEIFFPMDLKENVDVLFYGSYQPLQGVEFIIKAAEYLPGVNFKMIGGGQTRITAEKLVRKMSIKNVIFEDWVPMKDLNLEINKARIVLGIFGKSLKAKSVIPNKVYDGLACRKAVITLRTSASLESLEKVCLLVNDEKKLAEEIRLLLRNSAKRKIIAEKGYQFYLKNLRPEIVVKGLLA